MLIGIYGRKRSGKNTLATAIAQQVPGTSILSFAAPLKELCVKVFGLTEEQVDGEEKEVPFGYEHVVCLDDYIPFLEEETGLKLTRQFQTAFSPRSILQLVGTNYIRNARESFWIDQAEFALNDLGNHGIFADVRFPNEAEFIRSRGGSIIETVRLGLEHTDPHPSENAEICSDITIKVGDGGASEIHRRARLILEGLLPR